ncbi:hypothetical protein CAMRE0001_0126 [Campylobacter rectus RM3267]|uniref:Uncharacterized protein n=1 Tax=Campylobacter rectus RM3267 TaxID=553218 RepID=B9CXT6_CAMRE|nr:hypothetical protein CAMRE0001_0126 [Campylobacter rectus RM3267]
MHSASFFCYFSSNFKNLSRKKLKSAPQNRRALAFVKSSMVTV